LSKATAYTTRIDPGRAVPARRWISPGLAGRAPAGTPTMDSVGTELAHRIAGAYLVGHNVTVDWRLLHRRWPHITITGLIDTYRLAKAVRSSGKHGLAGLLTDHKLTDKVAAKASSSQPHRALWDAIGAALLLDALIQQHWSTEPSLPELLTVASPPTAQHREEPATLFD
jgi:DNA polymerase III subunit epsilon